MYRRKLLAVAVSAAALATTAAPAGAAPVRPEPQADHIIAVLIGQVQTPPAAAGFFKQFPGLDSETEGFMDYTDDV
jgi:opacity protein-like surface antigen